MVNITELTMRRLKTEQIREAAYGVMEIQGDTEEVTECVDENLDEICERLNFDEIVQADLQLIWDVVVEELNTEGGSMAYTIAWVRFVKKALKITAPFIIE
jgi:hypothetical protein